VRITLGPQQTAAGQIFSPLDPVPGDPPPAHDTINDFFQLANLRPSRTNYQPFDGVDVDWTITQVGSIAFSNYRFGLFASPPERPLHSDLAETIPTGGIQVAGSFSGAVSSTLYREGTMWIMGTPRGGNAWQTLGSPVTISPDTSSCTVLSIPRPYIDTAVTDQVSDLTSSTASVVLRGEVTVSWITSYISYAIPLRLVLENFFNANLDVVLRVGFDVIHRQTVSDVDVSIGYDFDVVFTKWENIGSFGVASKVEGAIEGILPLILECVKTSGEMQLMVAILNLIESAGPNKRLLQIRIVDDPQNSRVEIVTCPI
jgi:hypothetical protein